MAEAGTGVGKSFAYLLPAMYFALANKEKVIISTATITLQQQLFEKDIPLVSSAMGDVKLKSVIMKGRGNYLCMRRLNDALAEPSLFDLDFDELSGIYNWSKVTKTGEKTELEKNSSEAVWPNVCSESDLCLGTHCPWKEQCFINAMRKEANSANIIVVNHHLLFADLAARFQGAGYENSVVLPPFSRLIIDEAHRMESAATSFFSAEFSKTGLFRQLGRLYHKKRAAHFGLIVKLCAMIVSIDDPLDDIADIIAKIKTCSEELDECALDICGQEGIYRLCGASDESFLKRTLFPHLKSLRRNLLELTNIIRDITENFDEEQANEPIVWEVKSIMRRFEGIAEICDVFCKYKKHEDEVLWMEKNRKWIVFTRTPLDLAPKLRDSVFKVNKTVICVSATLAINEDFGFWANQCGITGIDDRQTLSGCFPSPFPYSSAVLLASPDDAPLPDETGYQDFVNIAAEKLISASGGSALVLFTSYQSLENAYNAAKTGLQSLGIHCLKQGDDDRSRLLQIFLNEETSCLFATDSFWEGVDAPGDTLRLVIICRLPFRTPGDPLLEARREKIEKEGGNPFLELSLPQAVMKFKQGFGRLMRRSADRGVVAVLDGRLLKKAYGKLFLQSLPETMTSFCSLNNNIRDIENFIYK